MIYDIHTYTYIYIYIYIIIYVKITRGPQTYLARLAGPPNSGVQGCGV